MIELNLQLLSPPWRKRTANQPMKIQEYTVFLPFYIPVASWKVFYIYFRFPKSALHPFKTSSLRELICPSSTWIHPPWWWDSE